MRSIPCISHQICINVHISSRWHLWRVITFWGAPTPFVMLPSLHPTTTNSGEGRAPPLSLYLPSRKLVAARGGRQSRRHCRQVRHAAAPPNRNPISRRASQCERDGAEPISVHLSLHCRQILQPAGAAGKAGSGNSRDAAERARFGARVTPLCVCGLPVPESLVCGLPPRP